MEFVWCQSKAFNKHMRMSVKRQQSYVCAQYAAFEMLNTRLTVQIALFAPQTLERFQNGSVRSTQSLIINQQINRLRRVSRELK